MKKIATIGAGNWGTALAATFAQLGHAVTLWAYEAEVVESIRSRHENELFMPGIKLPENLSASGDLGEALAGAEIVVTVMPSHVCGTIFQQMLPAPAARDDFCERHQGPGHRPLDAHE